MLLNKTALAREALQSGRSAGLGLRERRILILTDGKRTLNDVMSLLGSDILPMIDRLLREGYITDANASTVAPASTTNGVASAFTGLLRATTEAVKARTEQIRSNNAQQASEPAPATASTPAPVTAQGAPRGGQRRSLVAAKMYMVDMLQLQRHPDAVELKARIQFANGQVELLDAILDGMRVLAHLTNEGFGQRIMARLGEVLPEEFLPALAQAIAALRAPAPAGARQLKIVG